MCSPRGNKQKISLSGSSTDLRTYQGTGFALPTASLTGSQVSAVRQPRGVSTPLFFNFFQNRYEMQKGPLTNHLLIFNVQRLSGSFILLRKTAVECCDFVCCSPYCSLGMRRKESRTGYPAFLSKFIVIAVNKSIAFRDGKKITGIRLSPDTRYFVPTLPDRCSFRNFGLNLFCEHLSK